VLDAPEYKTIPLPMKRKEIQEEGRDPDIGLKIAPDWEMGRDLDRGK